MLPYPILKHLSRTSVNGFSLHANTILSSRSKPRFAALRQAARRHFGLLLRPGAAAIAASEGRPSTGDTGMFQGCF